MLTSDRSHPFAWRPPKYDATAACSERFRRAGEAHRTSPITKGSSRLGHAVEADTRANLVAKLAEKQQSFAYKCIRGLPPTACPLHGAKLPEPGGDSVSIAKLPATGQRGAEQRGGFVEIP